MDGVLTVHCHTCFFLMKAGCKCVLCFPGICGICLFMKPACYVSKDSNLELSVGVTQTYSYLVIGLNVLKRVLWSLNVLNTFALFQNTFYSAGKNYLLRMCNGEW